MYSDTVRIVAHTRRLRSSARWRRWKRTKDDTRWSWRADWDADGLVSDGGLDSLCRVGSRIEMQAI